MVPGNADEYSSYRTDELATELSPVDKSTEGPMPDEFSALIAKQNELLKEQNRFLSDLANRLPDKPSGRWKNWKIILSYGLILAGLLPLWELSKEVVSARERRRSFRVLVSSGDILLSKGDVEEAGKTYAEALSLAPGSADARMKMTEANATAVTQKYENIFRRLNPTEKEEIQKLVANCTLLVQMRPKDGQAFRLLGLALQLGNRLDESVEAFKTAISYSPQDYNIYNQLGNTYRKKGEPNEATESFNRAIKLAADSGTPYAHAYNNRGLVLFEQKKYHDAQADFERAIAIDESYFDPYVNRGNLFVEVAQERGAPQKATSLANAARDFLHAIALNPDIADGYYGLGNVFYQGGRWEAAIECYEKAAKLDPLDADFHENHGSALANLGKFREAVQQYSLAIDLSPDKISAYENRAKVYLKIGEGEKERASRDEAMAMILGEIKARAKGSTLKSQEPATPRI